ncbi:MAG: hypothetical protein LBD23_14710 [Oscillospiraceae bacterium]|jgi:hypothetical protein|nr:hypothetical protein [Oscillospiraceae bacterium]
MQTLILYATKYGAAAEIAKRIADKINGAVVRGVNEAELLMPTYTEYIQNLYREGDFHGSKYFGIELRDESVLCDVKSLIDIRARTK